MSAVAAAGQYRAASKHGDAGPSPVRFFRPTNLLLEITDKCNLRCGYCSVDATHSDLESAPEYPLRIVQRVADYLLKGGGSSLALSGGEPLLVTNIWRILDCSTRAIRTVLSTNGTRITQDAAARLADLPNLHVMVSLDSLDEASHERNRGRGSYRRAMEAIERLLGAGMGPRMSLRAVLTAHSIGGAVSLLRFVHANQIASLNATFVESTGRAVRGGPAPPSLEQMERLAGELWSDPECRYLALLKSDLLQLLFLRPPQKGGDSWHGCRFADSVRIDARGELFPCLELTGPRYSLGNIFRGDIADVIAAAQPRIQRLVETTEARPKEIEECKTCEWEIFCAGGCPAHAGDFENLPAPDSLCRYRKLMFAKFFQSPAGARIPIREAGSRS
jgi:radical SAM protein with 4Fe4S-binding SPASM domain